MVRRASRARNQANARSARIYAASCCRPPASTARSLDAATRRCGACAGIGCRLSGRADLSYQRGAAAGKLLLEPFDGGEIEMVSSAFGSAARMRDWARARAPAPPVGPRRRRGARGLPSPARPDLLQDVTRLMAIVAGPRRLPVSECRCRGRRNSGSAADSGRSRRAAGSACRGRARQPGGDLEQGRLARSRCDRPGRHARRPRPRAPRRQQRRAAEGQSDIPELNEGRGHSQTFGAARSTRRMVSSSAERKAERSRGENGGGPRVRLAGRAQVVHQVAHRQRHADRLLSEGAAIRAMTSAPAFNAPVWPAGWSAVSRYSAGPGALRDPIVGGVHPRARGDPLDHRVRRHADEGLAATTVTGRLCPRGHANTSSFTGQASAST